VEEIEIAQLKNSLYLCGGLVPSVAEGVFVIGNTSLSYLFFKIQRTFLLQPKKV
jgi:hypothetical protein